MDLDAFRSLALSIQCCHLRMPFLWSSHSTDDRINETKNSTEILAIVAASNLRRFFSPAAILLRARLIEIEVSWWLEFQYPIPHKQTRRSQFDASPPGAGGVLWMGAINSHCHTLSMLTCNCHSYTPMTSESNASDKTKPIEALHRMRRQTSELARNLIGF